MALNAKPDLFLFCEQARPSMALPSDFEVSVVIPCLNEHETLAICVQKATETLRNSNIVGEVVVADNGSTDGSIEIAQRLVLASFRSLKRVMAMP